MFPVVNYNAFIFLYIHTGTLHEKVLLPHFQLFQCKSCRCFFSITCSSLSRHASASGPYFKVKRLETAGRTDSSLQILNGQVVYDLTGTKNKRKSTAQRKKEKMKQQNGFFQIEMMLMRGL